MGSVEVALETPEDGPERVVALKRMLPNAVLDKRQTEMFLREAKLASLLVHPNVVRATSFGEIHGELFLVMEYIEGEPLSSVVAAAHAREGSLPLPIILHVLAEICEGLHAAHELKDEAGRPLNVVHRDVSPHNVMVAYEGQIKLLDFGVAKIEAIDAEGRTKTGEVKGKTAYMSPEQAMGDAIDRRSDLYSIGAVLFEAVSGRKMWGGGTDLDVIRRLALEEPPSLAEAAPGTPEVICQLQKRLVSRDPAKRPATALDVARELRAFVATSGTPPDTRVVRSLMNRLFEHEIERRRAKLTAALEEVEIPGAGTREATIPAADATPVTATRTATAPSRPRWMRGSVLVASGLVLAAAAFGILQRGKETTASTTSAAPAPPSPASSLPASPRANVPPVTGAVPQASASLDSVSDAPRASSSSSPTPLPSAKSLGTTRVAIPRFRGDQLRPVRAPPPKPTAPLDVDPTPF
jgi:hypothetical protein